MTRGLFIFRRDLRLEDNLGLIALLKACDEVACMFVGTPEQLQKNKLRNPRAIAFLTESLADLAGDLKKRGGSLYVAQGDPTNEVIRVAKSVNATHLAFNIDYTPYARERDVKLSETAEKEGITIISTQDYALGDVIGLRTSGGRGNPQTVFTPFWRAVEAATIPHPISNRTRTKQLDIGDGEGLRTLESQGEGAEKLVHGGRREGLKKLRALKSLRGYSEGRHMLDMETSLMSAYHKFGCVSPRESYWRSVELWGRGNAWARQLIWRDFFQHRVWHWGARAGEDDGARSPQRIGNRGVWPGGVRGLAVWKAGRTGVPVVDAGMRQLAAVGYMHNRARMVVANFLTRNLMVNWREGERWFAEQLTDYDFSVNFMNWLGIAGLFKGDQPWRMMNPWIQSRERDPNAEQIRRWVPELRDVEIGDIHKWDDAEVRAKYAGRVDYPAPVVDYVETRGRYLDWVKTRAETDIM